MIEKIKPGKTMPNPEGAKGITRSGMTKGTDDSASTGN